MGKKKAIQLVSFQRERAYQYGRYNITMKLDCLNLKKYEFRTPCI